MIKYRKMNKKDLDQVIDIYMAYYNQVEGRAWTYETTYKRINPILTRQDAFCMVCEKDQNILGFALGYYEQYDDLFAYTLDEIVISKDHQRKGLGTDLMFEIESHVKDKGAAMVQLHAVDDEMHKKFYGKLDYKNTQGFISKAKWL